MGRQFFNGICMALADSVPGVSGGTIAFIMGFYDRLIGSINDLIYEKEKRAAVVYLMKLGAGWIVGMISAVLVLSSAFEVHIYLVSSLFMGFIIASIPLVIKEEKDTLVSQKGSIFYAIIGALIVVGITNLNQNSHFSGISLNGLSIPMMLYVYVAGIIAISAMFLPGISGSTLLLILGLYVPVISAVKELLHFNLAYLPGVAVFGLGIISGTLITVKGIKNCLERYRSQTMYTILGLMLGSLYAIVMGPASLDVPVEVLSFTNFNYITFVIGIAAVFFLQRASKRKEAVAFDIRENE